MKRSTKRQLHDTEIKARAKSLYLRGLSLKEVSEFLSISIRTLEFWQTSEKWTKDKQLNPIFETVYNMQQSGKTSKEIAEMFNISTKTVFNYLRRYREHLKQ